MACVHIVVYDNAAVLLQRSTAQICLILLMVVWSSVETQLALEPPTAVQLALDWWGSALASANSMVNGVEKSLLVKVSLANNYNQINVTHIFREYKALWQDDVELALN